MYGTSCKAWIEVYNSVEYFKTNRNKFIITNVSMKWEEKDSNL